VVANVTVQNLLQLLGEKARRLPAPGKKTPSGFVVYLGVDESAIPPGCPPHLQFLYDADGPIGRTIPCLSQSAGDDRAPTGQATIIASSFVDPLAWFQCKDYNAMKRIYTKKRSPDFTILPPDPRYYSTSRGRHAPYFARFTARAQGIVGGIGQEYPLSALGFANRTPSSIYGW